MWLLIVQVVAIFIQCPYDVNSNFIVYALLYSCISSFSFNFLSFSPSLYFLSLSIVGALQYYMRLI